MKSITSLLIVILWLGTPLSVLAATTADVVLTATPEWFAAPTNFQATLTEDQTILLTWDKNSLADATIIIGKIGSYPSTATDGYIVYSDAGESYEDTGVAPDDMLTNMFYCAWSIKDASYSDDYARANTGGTILAQLAQNLLVMAVVGLAYWRKEKALYLIAGMGAITFGGYYVATTSWLGILVIVLGVYTVYKGLFNKK